MKPKIIIIGAGGHGKVVLETILLQATYEVVGFIDISLAVGTYVYGSYKVILNQDQLHQISNFAEYYIIALGNNEIRQKLFYEASAYSKPALIIHPSAMVSPTAKVGSGSVVLANAVVSFNSLIGENTIINAATVIDHECNIGKHVHLSPGTLVGSNVEISDFYKSTIGQQIISFSTL